LYVLVSIGHPSLEPLLFASVAVNIPFSRSMDCTIHVCPVLVPVSITKFPHTCGTGDTPIELITDILLSRVSPIRGAFGKYVLL